MSDLAPIAITVQPQGNDDNNTGGNINTSAEAAAPTVSPISSDDDNSPPIQAAIVPISPNANDNDGKDEAKDEIKNAGNDDLIYLNNYTAVGIVDPVDRLGDEWARPIEAGLQHNDWSNPYQILREQISCCKMFKFICIRACIQWMWCGFCCGLFTWIKETILIMLGCRSTYKVPKDEDFIKLFQNTWPFTTLLIQPKDENYQLVDTIDVAECMDTTFEYEYQQPTKALFHKLAGNPNKADQWVLAAIQIMDQDTKTKYILLNQDVTRKQVAPYFNDETGKHADWIEAADKNNTAQWGLAKLYALNAVHYFIILEQHAYIHFMKELIMSAYLIEWPQDVANLPGSNIRKLLEPHFQYTQEINWTALESNFSVLNARSGSPGCVDNHTMIRKGLNHLIVKGYDEHRVSFETGLSNTEELKAPDVRLQPFMDSISKFTKTVCTKAVNDVYELKDEAVKATELERLDHFAVYLHSKLAYPKEFICRFQKDSKIDPSTGSEALAKICADVIFQCSVRHSSEHYGMAMSDQRIQPMALRLPWTIQQKFPNDNGCCAYRCGLPCFSGSAKVVTLYAWLKQLMYNSMFVYWWNNRLFGDGRLTQTTYEFTDDGLKQAAKTFTNSFKEIVQAEPKIMPLSELAKSIQW